jgi:hypothetical protein
VVVAVVVVVVAGVVESGVESVGAVDSVADDVQAPSTTALSEVRKRRRCIGG